MIFKPSVCELIFGKRGGFGKEPLLFIMSGMHLAHKMRRRGLVSSLLHPSIKGL